MINITFTADPLPADFAGTLQDFQDTFLANLRGTISETDVLTGQVGGTMPTTNVGPWLNGDTWYVWNGVEYVPATVKVGNTDFTVQLGAATTSGASKSTILADYTQNLQDKDGTVALLSDVYVGRAAVTLSGTNPTIDWNLGHNFIEVLTGNTTMKMSNYQDGQEITVALTNSGTSYTVAWPSYVFWTGSTPVQSASKTDLYIFKNIAGAIFGRQIAAFA